MRHKYILILQHEKPPIQAVFLFPLKTQEVAALSPAVVTEIVA